MNTNITIATKAIRLWLIILFLCIIGTTHLSAQMTIKDETTSSQQPQGNGPNDEPIVSARVFPLGALQVGAGAPLDSMQNMYMNVSSYFNNATPESIGPEDDSIFALTGGSWFWDICDRGRNAYTEARMYLFSGNGPTVGEKRILNRKFDNGTYNTFHLTANGDTAGGEYKINATDTVVKSSEWDLNANSHYGGNYIIRMPRLQTTDSNSDGGLIRRHYKQVYDFIYKLDLLDTNITNIHLDTPLYTIEVLIRGIKTASKYKTSSVNGIWKASMYDTIITFPITRKKFTDGIKGKTEAGADTQWWTDDLNHALREPQISGSPKYARIKMEFSDALMNRFNNVGMGSTDTLLSNIFGDTCLFSCDPSLLRKVVFDVRVRRNPNAAVPIYVKGLRMRNGGADSLLTGKLDYPELRNRFKLTAMSMYVKNGDTVQESDPNDRYYPKLLKIHVWQEPFPAHYYIMSYLDRYARDNYDSVNKKPSYKRITSFTPYQAEESRLIWDDILWKPNLTTAAPETFYRNIDPYSIFEKDRANQPVKFEIPIDALPKSQSTSSTTNMLYQRITPRSEVDDYERRADTMLWTTLRHPLQQVNQACFSLGTKPIPFWIMGQAYIGICRVDSHSDFDIESKPKLSDSAIKAKVIPILTAIQTTSGTLPNDTINRYAFRPTDFYDTTRMGYDRYNVTAEQIRLQANMSAAWGAKGYTVSNAGNDGTKDIGYSNDPHSTNIYDTQSESWDSTKRIMFSDVYIAPEDMKYVAYHKGTSALTFLDNPGNPDYDYDQSDCGGSVTMHDWKALPFTSNHYYVNDCSRSHRLWQWFPTFYGFKTRYRGTKNAMYDLNRAAKKLAELTWKAAVDVSGRDTTVPAFYQDSLPIKDITTVIQRKKRMSSETDISYSDSTISGVKITDDSTDRLLEIGVFKDPKDASAIYIYPVNRRVWPNKPSNDTSTSTSFLGNVAVRRVEFKIKPQLFGADSIASKWSVMDISTGNEIDVTPAATYRMLLEPGEGRLLRIAPSISTTVGNMSKNLYNNARHITAIEEGSTTFYGMTFEDLGKIFVTYPTEIGAGDLKRSSSSTPTIDNNTTNSHPAISYNPSNDTIGLVYQHNTPLAGQDSMDVRIKYRIAKLSNKLSFSTPVELAVFKAHKSFEATPAIASYQDGTFNFWVSWRDPKEGGVLGIVDNSSTLLDTAHIFKSTRTSTKFVSLATHKDATDSVFFACEENDKIYVGAASIDLDSNKIFGDLRGSPNLLHVSKSHSLCFHHNPQIVIDKNRNVGVTWDGRDRVFKWKGKQVIYPHYVVSRFRNPTGLWGKFTTIRVFEKPDSLGYTKDTLRAYPNIAIASEMRSLTPPYTWDDSIRVVWNNPISKLVGISRVGNDQTNPVSWKIYNMKAPSVEPAMPYSFTADKVLHPVFYRSPFIKPTSEFNAKITHYDFPITDVAVNQNPRIGLIVKGGNCAELIQLQTDSNAVMKRPTIDSNIFDFDTIRFDVIKTSTPKWDDSTVRTQGIYLTSGVDTIWIYRFFQMGHFEPSDTADAQEGLDGYDDYVKLRLLMRKVSNHQILAVLDSAILTQMGYTSTFDEDNGSVRKAFVSTFTDSVYLTMEASRKNPANDYTVGLDVRYDDDPFTTEENDDDEPLPVFKIADGTPVSMSENELFYLNIVPNPFTKEAKIELDVPEGAPVTVTVFDILGKHVAKLYNGISEKEHLEFTLDGKMLQQGTYFVRVQAGNFVQTRKVQFIK